MTSLIQASGSARVAEPLRGVPSPLMGTGLGTPAAERPGRSLLAATRAWLPRGGELPDQVWQVRHRHIVSLAYLIALGCAVFAMMRGYRAVECLGLGMLIVVPAFLARNGSQRREVRSSLAAIGLLNACAVIIQAAGGATEAHFSFFVIIGLLTVYQDWRPFLVSIGYVVVHHGVLGTMMPMSVFDHSAAWRNPWVWASIHGSFIVAASITYLVAWRMNEQYQAQVRRYSTKLVTSEERFRTLVQRSSDVTMVCDRAGQLSYVSAASVAVLGMDHLALPGHPVGELIHPDDQLELAELIGTVTGAQTLNLECRLASTICAEPRWVEITVTDLSADPAIGGVVLHLREVTRRRQLEAELRHSQKLESVGQLAAGIAHEINTPVQFVGDNLRFLRDAFTDQFEVLQAYRQVGGADSASERARQLDIERDCAYLSTEVPLAIEQTLTGVDRVATIVRAMKAFGHPSGESMADNDLNQAIRNTLVVAGNALKYNAEVHTDLGPLPLVRCHIGEINQVVLNLLVNAAQAIAGHAQPGELGLITVRTYQDGPNAVIEISDNGGGIAEQIRERIFEPFFTTKDVGVGTGQGLYIAYGIVRDRHGGSITVSNTGGGACFTVRLPIGAGAERVGPVPAELKSVLS